MFPAPSPNSQAFINSLTNGIATPGTLDFHRTALNAAARNGDRSTFPNGLSQPQEHRAQIATMDTSTQRQSTHHHFGQHDNDAANGLFLLAQAGNETQSANQFAIPNQPAHIGSQPLDNSPHLGKRPHRNLAGSSGSVSNSARDQSEISAEASDGIDQLKPNTRAKAKRSSTGKANNNRRKVADTPAKQPTAKKAKNNNGNVVVNTNFDMSMEGDSDEEIVNMKEDQYHENGKKMTDEEKRKNFLERNR